jgi:hypothetical protein
MFRQKEVMRFGVGGKQGLDFGTQGGILRARLVQKSVSVFLLAF